MWTSLDMMGSVRVLVNRSLDLEQETLKATTTVRGELKKHFSEQRLTQQW